MFPPPSERGPGVIVFMILNRHIFKMQRSVPVSFCPRTRDICCDPQCCCRDNSESQVTWAVNSSASFLAKICLQAFSYLLWDRQMDVYGRFQICNVSSTLSFMNVCRFLIAWQAGCCKQPIFYAYMKCNHEVYDVTDWWPWKVEQEGLEDLRLGKNGWFLCDT